MGKLNSPFLALEYSGSVLNAARVALQTLSFRQALIGL